MGNQPWLDRVRERLVRQALPSAYIRRFMEELSDHLEDLKEESMGADAHSRLGEPEQVAEATVVAYRRRSFLGRHPAAAFMVFAVSPVIAMYGMLIVFLTVLTMFGAQRTVEFNESRLTISLIIVVCSPFVGALYGELALWLGLGRKWTLASCAVLGVVAMLFEIGFRSYTVMLLVQFSVPLGVGWWLTRRKCNRGYPATTFLVFAISPVASYMLLLTILGLVMVTAQPDLHFGRAATLAWLFVIFLLPMVVPSLLYCKLVGRFGIDRKWMLVSCTVLAMFAAMLYIPRVGYATEENGPLLVGLATCFILAHSLVPLAIGWWFMRRKHDQGQLELAA